MSEYITDGVDMYEVVYERDDQNYGRLGGELHVFVVRHVNTGVGRRMGEIERAAYEPVRRAA